MCYISPLLTRMRIFEGRSRFVDNSYRSYFQLVRIIVLSSTREPVIAMTSLRVNIWEENRFSTRELLVMLMKTRTGECSEFYKIQFDDTYLSHHQLVLQQCTYLPASYRFSRFTCGTLHTCYQCTMYRGLLVLQYYPTANKLTLRLKKKSKL
jgi:hypothetical protein